MIRSVSLHLLLDDEEIAELKRRSAHHGFGHDWRKYASSVATDAIASMLPCEKQEQRTDRTLLKIKEVLA